MKRYRPGSADGARALTQVHSARSVPAVALCKQLGAGKVLAMVAQQALAPLTLWERRNTLTMSKEHDLHQLRSEGGRGTRMALRAAPAAPEAAQHRS